MTVLEALKKLDETRNNIRALTEAMAWENDSDTVEICGKDVPFNESAYKKLQEGLEDELDDQYNEEHMYLLDLEKAVRDELSNRKKVYVVVSNRLNEHCDSIYDAKIFKTYEEARTSFEGFIKKYGIGDGDCHTDVLYEDENMHVEILEREA